MIFLSAQPDEYYFLWQLQLQLFNFNSLGVHAENIHVLIGYHLRKGLSREFAAFIQTCKLAQFYTYPDTRQNKIYLSSLRPYIIAKHFQAFPNLQQETIFYHDSDIVFKNLPDFESLRNDNVWYTSDTRNYLDLDYINHTAGETVFNEMCGIVGIEPNLVKANNENAGGAQYLLKKCSTGFWQKMETDCEQLYQLLENHNAKTGFCKNENYTAQIQAWCADMWALWWNALLAGKQFKIHPDLNFCWANSPVEAWKEARILHYTGRILKKATHLFRKENYINYPPYYESLEGISENTCSYFLKQVMDAYCKSQLTERIDLSDVSFLIPVRLDSEDRLENLFAITAYIQAHFKTSILILEADDTSKINATSLPTEVTYFFVKDLNPKLHRTKYHNQLIAKATTPHIALYDADVVFPLNQIIQAVTLLRNGNYAMVSPYNGSFVSVDSLQKAMFMKLQDAELFEANQRKLITGTKRSFGGCMFMNRQHYIEAGMENEKITSWGPDDVERVKRMEILGYKIKRLQGNLYHLPHARGSNSIYESIEERCDLMSEYLKICGLEKKELSDYIRTWH